MKTKLQEDILWIFFPIVIVFFPALLIILSLFLSYLPLNISLVVSFLAGSVGFYYMETIALFFLSLYIYALYRRATTKFILIIAFLTTLSVVFLYIVHGYFMNMLGQADRAGDPQSFINGLQSTDDFLLKLGFSVHIELSTSGRVNGIFGIIFGLFSVYCAYLEATSSISRETQEASKHLVGCVTILSIIIAVMIFAARAEEYLYTIRHVFSIAAPFFRCAFLPFGNII